MTHNFPRNVLDVPICGYGEEPRIIQFADKTKDPESHIRVNYDAYIAYINEHYPDLHTIDIQYEFEQEIIEKKKDPKYSEFNAQEEADREEFDRQFKHDNTLLNRFDIEQYNDLDSADDVWDSIARSVYNMGYIGKYSRTALSLEAGINYIFSFEDFAHIYPFMKTHQGDGSLVRKILNLEDVDYRRFDSYKLFYQTLPQNRLGEAAHDHYNLKDLEAEKRSPFNHSLLVRLEIDNPPGSEWSYLTVDKDVVKLGNSYRRGYLYVPPNKETATETEPTTDATTETNNDDPDNENNDNRYPTKSSEFSPPYSKFEGGRYIYEKYLFCTVKGCSGSMRAVLDCIHNVVILSTTNPHCDCGESQKRQVYDIVKKLFVINHGDLDTIDIKYATIPRRFGLTHIEAWVNYDEFDYMRSCEYQPTFFRYNINSYDQSSKSWASQKNRNWIIDSFYEMVDESEDPLHDTLKHNKHYHKKRKRKPTHLDIKQTYPLGSRKGDDLRNHGVASWNFDNHRTDNFGNIIRRGEWEFHVTQESDARLREIYRLWRKSYFGLSDFIRQNTFKFPMNKSLEMVSAYLKQGGDYKIDTEKIKIFSFNDNDDEVNHSRKLLNDLYVSINDSNRFNWEDFDQILFRQDPALKILPNPEFFVIPYPLNKQVATLLNDKENVLDSIEPEMGCIFLLDSPVDEIFNCSDIIICERSIDYESAKKSEAKATNARIQSLHPSDQMWELEPTFKESIGFMQVYDSDFLKGRYISKRFKGDKLLNYRRNPHTNGLNTILFKDLEKFPKCYFKDHKAPDKLDSSDKSYYSGFFIMFKTEGVMKNGFMFTNKRNVGDVVKLIQSKRSVNKKLNAILLVDPKHGLVSNSDVDIIQLHNFNLFDLKKHMPYEMVLLFMHAIVSNESLEQFEAMLKTKLPSQRKKDTDFFKFEYEGIRAASNAGIARSAIKLLTKAVGDLNKYETKWRIQKSGPIDDFNMAPAELSTNFISGSRDKLNMTKLIEILANAKNNEHNISIANDSHKVEKLKWAIQKVIEYQKTENFDELIAGRFRDIYELIKRSIDFL